MLNEEIPDKVQLVGQKDDEKKQEVEEYEENMYDRMFNLDFAKKLKNHKPNYCASTIGAVLMNVACQGNPGQIAQRHKAHVQLKILESLPMAIAEPDAFALSNLLLTENPSVIDSPPNSEASDETVVVSPNVASSSGSSFVGSDDSTFVGSDTDDDE
eukprot:CAMPEP_0117422260 /NCGR_PEP_ID=MMETSP0758-20121206/3137_1 /TAXON_ID=63605 /ORGANISM="Percolomonas cosmopolitus, Strain AE-1 (ATCC 50343)" /LENGTH=156 /DNA_ID=CAMNT_0005204777 /DNA_START=2807 /DNA_END=3277 /DNA_ORIENTATION=+